MFSLSAKQQLLPRLPTIVKNPYFCCSNLPKRKTNLGEFIFQKPLRKVLFTSIELYIQTRLRLKDNFRLIRAR